MKKQSSKGHTIKGCPFKDATQKASGGAPTAGFEGHEPTKLDGDAHLNGQKLVIGFGLKDFFSSPDGDA
jgi:hypothetical protein